MNELSPKDGYSIILRNSRDKIASNFRENEFFTDDKFFSADSHYLDTRLIEAAQFIRDAVGVPVHITDSFRTVKGNALIKGAASNSAHLTSQAIDLKWNGWDSETIKDLRAKLSPEKSTFFDQLFSIGVRGFGIYDGHLHIDVAKVSTRKLIHNGEKFAVWDSSTVGKSPSAAVQDRLKNKNADGAGWLGFAAVSLGLALLVKIVTKLVKK